MKHKNKKKKSFSKILLPWIIVAIMLYTVAAFILQFFTSVEISSTLTTAYFSFWTIEIISLAGIKTMKVKGKKEEVREVDETENEEL
jgi:ABC-type multidrug transport system permease subunit